MIAAVFFDLDNCLSAGREVPERVYEPAFEAIRAANGEWLSEEQLERALEDAWRFAIDDVAERHGFSERMREVVLVPSDAALQVGHHDLGRRGTAGQRRRRIGPGDHRCSHVSTPFGSGRYRTDGP